MSNFPFLNQKNIFSKLVPTLLNFNIIADLQIYTWWKTQSTSESEVKYRKRNVGEFNFFQNWPAEILFVEYEGTAELYHSPGWMNEIESTCWRCIWNCARPSHISPVVPNSQFPLLWLLVPFQSWQCYKTETQYTGTKSDFTDQKMLFCIFYYSFYP